MRFLSSQKNSTSAKILTCMAQQYRQLSESIHYAAYTVKEATYIQKKEELAAAKYKRVKCDFCGQLSRAVNLVCCRECFQPICPPFNGCNSTAKCSICENSFLCSTCLLGDDPRRALFRNHVTCPACHHAAAAWDETSSGLHVKVE